MINKQKNSYKSQSSNPPLMSKSLIAPVGRALISEVTLKAVSNNSNFFITCKESRIENNRSFYGSFYLGPFDPGQSITIANALRRTLLSSLRGIAIVSAQIDSVSHEYSSLEGVRDSVLDILLNLKEVVLRTQDNDIKKTNLHNLKPFYIGYLRVRGPGVVRAADLKLPPFIQIVDPQQYIATLAEDGFLNMKVIISEGQNYILQKQGKFNNTQGEFLNIQPTITKYKKQKSLASMKGLSPMPLSPSPPSPLGMGKGAASSPFPIPKGEGDGRDEGQQRSLSMGHTLSKDSAKTELPKSNFNETFMNPLMIDAIFTPVNKINYIIEYSEHKTIDNSFYKNEEINVLFNSLNFLTKDTIKSDHNKKVSSLNKLDKISSEVSFTNILNNQKRNLWEPTQLAEPNKFLKHNIILEIWTNGSIHPREALYQGLKQLIILFSKLEQLQITSINFKYERNSLKLVKKLKNSNYTTIPLNNSNYSSFYTPSPL
jgi:DNA-directed RNA polymerase alpha subunit